MKTTNLFGASPDQYKGAAHGRQTRKARWLLIILTLFISLFIGASHIQAATNVSGNITQNTTWTLAGSPYIVPASISITTSIADGPPVTLTIEPGVEVRFNAGTGLTVGYNNGWHGYPGALSARGTSAAPITFTSNAAIPQPGDWQGIIFDDTTAAATTILDNCIVEYGGSGGYGNLTMSNASPTIKNSIIRSGSATGIYLSGPSNPIIGGEDAGNTITGNAGYGIYSDGNTSSTTMIISARRRR